MGHHLGLVQCVAELLRSLPVPTTSMKLPMRRSSLANAARYELELRRQVGVQASAFHLHSREDVRCDRLTSPGTVRAAGLSSFHRPASASQAGRRRFDPGRVLFLRALIRQGFLFWAGERAR